MENIVMFIVGTIIFLLYMIGYLFMVTKQNQLQDEEIKKRSFQVRKNALLDTEGFTIGGSISRVKSKSKTNKATSK